MGDLHQMIIHDVPAKKVVVGKPSDFQQNLTVYLRPFDRRSPKTVLNNTDAASSEPSYR